MRTEAGKVPAVHIPSVKPFPHKVSLNLIRVLQLIYPTMANPDHLNIIAQGVDVWNKWRRENPDITPDLSTADLREADLTEIDLTAANLRGVDFSFAYLTKAGLREAELSKADLTGADLTHTDLSKANLSGANLRWADVCHANLQQVNFAQVILSHTTFADVDLNVIAGIDSVQHMGPSHICIDTLYRSKGIIPPQFLRDAGVPDNFIEHIGSLVGTPFEYYSCFISYSSNDEEFAKKLQADLRSNAVRCWFAPEDLKTGDPFRKRIDEAILLYDKLLIVLSDDSVGSPWVEKEVETAFDKESEQGQAVLFPIRIDEAVMETEQAWAADIRRTRHIGDFREWDNHDSYKKAFDRLLRDLKADNKAKSAVQK